ncbi:MAG: prephenate dehydratase [Marinifilaceae bacterium]|nr:prephenate dehydratase [Marinifilaceae bacterium]
MISKIAIQGIQGCFHEEAARIFYGKDVEILPCANFEDEFEQVNNGRADGLIMAIENTVAGALLPNYALLHKYGKAIKGEVFLPIRQNLLVMPGVKMEELKEVHSHYMAIAQCREFFKDYPHIRLVEASDTASAAREVAERGDRSVGAIASVLAAEMFGLDVLAPSIETHKQNFTRFLIMDDRLSVPSYEINKASLCFTLPHQQGSLSHILSIFSFYELNLTKIQSLPIVGKEWQYFFYVDLKFNDFDRYRKAVDAVRPLVADIEVLGEYKSFG